MSPHQSTKAASFFENRLLDYKQAAELLGVSESYLRRLKSRGVVPFVELSNRCIRFRFSSLNEWVQK